jgi:hypothetical protein
MRVCAGRWVVPAGVRAPAEPDAEPEFGDAGAGSPEAHDQTWSLVAVR